jgi:4-amino-4-deoxy-L-arabinose transferase-like glycosyltransferase
VAKHFLRQYGLLLLVLIVPLLLALPTLTYPLGRDQGEFATIARGILQGRVPYTELWNPKPPAVFYVYAAAMQLFGQTSIAIRLLDFLVVPLISLLLFDLGRSWLNRSVGLWAAFLIPVFYFSETFWTLTQNDGLVLLPMVAAIWLVWRGIQPGRGHWLYLLLAGVLCGYAVWFKYPFILFVVVTAAVILAGLPGGWLTRQKFMALAVLAVGMLLSLTGGVLALVAQGAWAEFLLSARVTADYTRLTLNWEDFRELMRTALEYRWLHWGLLFLLAGMGGSWLLMRWRRAALPTTDRIWLRMLWLWLAITLAIMLVQAKAYDYHWLPMLPPLVLLSAGMITVLAVRLRMNIHLTRFIPSLQIVLAIVLLGLMAQGIWGRSLPYLTGQEDQATYYGRFQAGEFVADESLRVAQFLQERVVRGDSLYIWGFRPEVYYLSGLNPPTRFIFQFPLVGEWYPAAWREENVEILWAALPPYVLVLQVDYMPWVTGSDADSNTLLQSYTGLNDWLIFNYEPETQIGNFFVWRRKSPPA